MTAAAKSYFRYHLRSKWKLLLLVVLLSFIFTAVSTMGQKYEYIVYDAEARAMVSEVGYDSLLDTSFWIFVVCGYLFPITEFYPFLKRRNIDCLFALPVTRREMGIIHYITGMLCMIIPYTVSYLTNFLFLLRYPEGFDYLPLLTYYLLSLLVGICAYSVNIFVFNKADSAVDGIIFMAAWSCIFWLIADVYDNYINVYNMERLKAAEYNKTLPYWLGIDVPQMGNPWGTLAEIREAYSCVIEKHDYFIPSDFWHDEEYFVWFVFWIVLGTASSVSFIFEFGKRRAEKIGEISGSWFGYKVLIPLYAVVMQFSSDLLSKIFTLIYAFLAFIVFRRGFQLKKSDWITLGCLLLTGIILFIIFVQLTGQYIW